MVWRQAGVAAGVASSRMGSRHFRAGVVAVVRRSDGQVLAFERADGPGNWQLPQGGLEKGEPPIDAAWRELGEETGLGPADVALVAAHAWDVQGASRAGLSTGWVARGGAVFPRMMEAPDVKGDTLTTVAKQLVALR